MDELIQAVVQGKSDVALYHTCELVYKNEHEDLENAFIELSSMIGAENDMFFVATWNHINRKLVRLIDSEAFHIAEVLEMTTMLMLMHQRLRNPSIKTKASYGKLRKKILEHFPEKARLSYRGMETFDAIIPKQPEDVNAFVHRILAGFSRLLDEKKHEELHQALIYLSKRQIQLPLPHVWPAPDEPTAQQGDTIWMLWGMLILYFKNDFVATNFKLFCCNWKKKWKTKRLGLMYGIAYSLCDSAYELVWSKHEETIVAKVLDIAPRLWQDFLDEKKTAHEEENPEEAVVDAMQHFAFFEPRGAERPHFEHNIEGIRGPVKTIDLNSRSKTKMDIRPTSTKIKKVDAPSHFDSRYWGVDFSA